MRGFASEICFGQGGDPKKIVKKYGFIVFKMTAQNIRSEQKKLQHSRLQSGREIYEKLSKPGGLVWLGDFAVIN